MCSNFNTDKHTHCYYVWRNRWKKVFKEAARLFCLSLSLVYARTENRCFALESGYDADVLILGAGMSGISAAKSLQENGVDDFMIIEAQDRIMGWTPNAQQSLAEFD